MVAPVAGLTLALAGCSIRPQAEPVPVSAPVVLPGTSTPTPKGVPLTVQAYFLRGNHLTRISRTVPPSAGLAPSLAALAQPLSAAQVAAGLRTALPTSGRPLQGKVADGVALVEMPPGYDRLGVREQINALGQLVFTISANSLAGSLQLTRDGKPLPVPDGNGHLVDRPVSRSDYAGIQPAG